MTNITLLSHSTDGRIVFIIKSVRYTYYVDYGAFLRCYKENKHKSGKLLNWVKANGELFDKEV